MYLLDTNHIVCWQYGNSVEYGFLKSRLERISESDVFVSIVSFHEEIVGWNKYLSRATNSPAMVKAYSKFEQILRDFGSMQLLPFDNQAADVFDELVRRKIRRVGVMDLRIAAIAIANQAILLTQNTVDFERIPNLQIDDWMTASDRG
jgi:tRNA(fMet)-specific endonuclease VapC